MLAALAGVAPYMVDITIEPAREPWAGMFDVPEGPTGGTGRLSTERKIHDVEAASSAANGSRADALHLRLTS